MQQGATAFAPAYPQQPQTGARRFNEPAKFIPLMFMCVTILGLYLIYVLTHCLVLLQFDTKPSHVDEEMRRRGLWQITWFHWIFVLLVLCYARCVMTSPGEIPDNDPRWIYIDPTDPSFADSSQLNLQELKRSGQRRHCKWCSKYKPDRCHHCRVCRTCILKMDHHCPWIYNCVGFGNYKYFFLLIMYTVIATNFIWTTMLESALRSIDNNAPFMTCFLHVFGVTLAFCWAVVLTLFWSFHVWLMFKAMTIIEFCEKSSQPKKGLDPAQHQASGYSSIYDRGCWGNIKAVLGNNPLLFFLPVNPPEGDGMAYLSESTPLGGGGPAPYGGQYQPPPYQQPSQTYAPQQPYQQGQYGGGYQQPGSQQYAQQQQQYAQQQQQQQYPPQGYQQPGSQQYQQPMQGGRQFA